MHYPLNRNVWILREGEKQNIKRGYGRRWRIEFKGGGGGWALCKKKGGRCGRKEGMQRNYKEKGSRKEAVHSVCRNFMSGAKV